MNKKEIEKVLYKFAEQTPVISKDSFSDVADEILKLQSPKAEEGRGIIMCTILDNGGEGTSGYYCSKCRVGTLNPKWDGMSNKDVNNFEDSLNQPKQIEIPTWIECSKLLTDQEKLTPLHQFIYTYGNDSRLWKNYFERAIKHLNK